MEARMAGTVEGEECRSQGDGKEEKTGNQIKLKAGRGYCLIALKVSKGGRYHRPSTSLGAPSSLAPYPDVYVWMLR